MNTNELGSELDKWAVGIIKDVMDKNPPDKSVGMTVKETYNATNGKPFAKLTKPGDEDEDGVPIIFSIPNTQELFLLPGDDVLVVQRGGSPSDAYITITKKEPISMNISFDNIVGTTLTLSFTSPYTDVDLNDYIYSTLVGEFRFSKSGQTNQELNGTLSSVSYADVGGYNVATATISLSSAGLVTDTSWTLFSAYLDLPAPAGGTGEANTASNVGTGIGVYKQKTGVNLEFKSLVADKTISLTENTNDIEISSSIEYLVLTKSSDQSTSTTSTVVSFDGSYTIDGSSLLSKDGNNIKCLANCNLVLTATFRASGFATFQFCKFRIYKNGVLYKETVMQRGGSTGSSLFGATIVTEPIICSTNDYFYMEVNSSDTSLTISSGTFISFSGKAWNR